MQNIRNTAAGGPYAFVLWGTKYEGGRIEMGDQIFHDCWYRRGRVIVRVMTNLGTSNLYGEFMEEGELQSQPPFAEQHISIMVTRRPFSQLHGDTILLTLALQLRPNSYCIAIVVPRKSPHILFLWDEDSTSCCCSGG